MDELLQWPWQRFERFYTAFMQRSLIESLERRKDAMIAALWSNSNYDDDKGTRKGAIEEIEENFRDVVDIVRNGPEPEEELDEDNPFLAPALRATRELEAPRNDEGTVAEAVADDPYSKYIDQ